MSRESLLRLILKFLHDPECYLTLDWKFEDSGRLRSFRTLSINGMKGGRALGRTVVYLCWHSLPSGRSCSTFPQNSDGYFGTKRSTFKGECEHAAFAHVPMFGDPDVSPTLATRRHSRRQL